MSVFAALGRIPALLPYVRARRAYVRGQNPEALKHHSKVMRWTARPSDKAFHATLLVLNNRSADAGLLFEDAIKDLKSIKCPSEDQRYVVSYCRYYETMIAGGDGEEFRAAAEAAAVNQSLRRHLPLPPAQAVA